MAVRLVSRDNMKSIVHFYKFVRVFSVLVVLIMCDLICNHFMLGIVCQNLCFHSDSACGSLSLHSCTHAAFRLHSVTMLSC